MTARAHPEPFRTRLFEVIFEADSRQGKMFDIALLWAIVISLVAVMLESVTSIRVDYGEWLRAIEWTLTILFTAEYVLRIWAVKKPRTYILSFYGVVDLVSILPTYLSMIFVGTQSLLVIRGLRLLRAFRVLKLAQLSHEAHVLMTGLRASRAKILVFFGGVSTLVVVMATLMYLIEGEASGFTSIPRSMYWGIVTMTTVGYGDIAPVTVAGQALASLMMLIGYSIIAVPTGIVSSELAQAHRRMVTGQACTRCKTTGHEVGSNYCKCCGESLPSLEAERVDT